jgi:hypothetical protein
VAVARADVGFRGAEKGSGPTTPASLRACADIPHHMFVASVHRLLRSFARYDLGRPGLTDILPTKAPSGEQQNRRRRAAVKQPIGIRAACQLSPWDVPVIMIAAYGDAETKRRALENGPEALLTEANRFCSAP